MIRAHRSSPPLAKVGAVLRVLYLAPLRAEGRASGCSHVGSESTDNQTRCTLMSPKRQTCSVGKASSLQRAEIKNLVVFIWGCFLRQSLMGNELLCTQMCAGCSLKASDFFYFLFLGDGPRARVCLPSVYLMKYLCGSSGTMANVCALCSEKRCKRAQPRLKEIIFNMFAVA